MTYRHLRIFICVCDELNMTKAAEKLYISQPSVSQAILELENHYNIKLFERLGKKLFITQAGNKLLMYARHLVNLTDKLEADMKEISENGLIRIGASVTIGNYLLCDILKKYQGINKNIKISSLVLNTKNIEEKLLKDEIDIGLVEGIIHSNDIVVKPFMLDELVVVFPINHELSKKDFIEISDISKYDFILREKGSGTRELFENELNHYGININIVGEFNNSELIKNAVINELGISVISKKVIEQELQGNKLKHLSIKNVSLKRKFSIIYHKNKYITKTLDDFINLIIT